MKRLLLLACVLMLVTPVLVLAQDPPKQDAKPEKIDISGAWDMSIDTPQGQMALTVTFKQDGEKITGTQTSPMGESPLEGTLVGNELKYTITIDMQGQQATISFGAKVDGAAMSGVYEFAGMGSGAWTAKKKQ
jgi:hypothetical protein